MAEMPSEKLICLDNTCENKFNEKNAVAIDPNSSGTVVTQLVTLKMKLVILGTCESSTSFSNTYTSFC